jgi:hypothetical protein
MKKIMMFLAFATVSYSSTAAVAAALGGASPNFNTIQVINPAGKVITLVVPEQVDIEAIRAGQKVEYIQTSPETGELVAL